jgi:signal transduction histidine kinase
MLLPIVTMTIETESDVVAVRQRARRVAELLGFERQDQTRIATAVSEIARDAFLYVGGGRVEFIVEIKSSQLFRIRISDRGKGIANLQAILDGQYRSQNGMGLGLVGARCLMDRFDVNSNPDEVTTVDLGQHLPECRNRLTQAKLSEIATALKREDAVDPLAALRDQNRELIQSLEEIRRREEESKQLNRELGDTNRGVVALYAGLDERTEQLREASELKTRFLSNMSHEFRSPVNSIFSLSRLLLDRIDRELTLELEQQVGYIRRSAESLLELVNDLLDLAKVEAGKVEVKAIPFAGSSLFGALREALRPLQVNRSVELRFDRADDMPELLTGEAKVAQILRNLISNALKFTEKGEVRVRVQYETESKLAIFSGRDTGIGIASEDQTRIFEEFSQLDTRLQKKTNGTGLPLSRSLAELLGGTIRVESVLGQGSVFTLAIPARLGGAAAPAAELSKKRVLIIDDDDTFRYTVRQIISKQPRYEVLEASNGGEGLHVAKDEHPDVIVLDLQMPNVDGFTVLQQLNADQHTSMIPVVAATSLAVNAELKARLPVGKRLISKNVISREDVSLFLRDAVGSQVFP